MTDDASTRPSRPHPSYGLPGPTPVPGATSPAGSPGGPDAAVGAYGAPAPQGPPSRWTPADGTSGASGGVGPGDTPGSGDARGSGAPKRRGILPLVLGFLSLALSVVALIIGLFVGGGSMMGVLSSGLTPVSGPTEVAAESGQMYLVYIPEGSATTCTADGTTPDAAVTVPAQVGSAPLGPNGETYEPVLGVQASESTTITITCTGEDAGYMGPVDATSAMVPLGIGFLVGTVLGILGLVLIIVGIVRLVRSRRA
ncbi:hypothetical protein [Brachybacterium nesterenkovii]|uniref:hypothetical protein n=1 Tax=Brachybacterium nesterenkovii TaxID=47847 RepID=UPI00321BE817